ncbi:MAG: hypothetical protein AB7G15_11610, partial [Alphaproteobacteria bacterium]
MKWSECLACGDVEQSATGFNREDAEELMAGKASHIHIDHVGSLLRPIPLREDRQRILGVHDAD